MCSAEKFPKPTEMVKHLDRFVRGQDKAKLDVSTAVYSHYMAPEYAKEPDALCSDFGPQNILIIGPTGSGKTFMIRILAEYLKKPFVFGNATSLSETGYVGEDVQSLVRNLLKLTGNKAELAEGGIVFLDEFDKIKRAEMAQRDVSGEGVQNGLLTFLDGGKTPIALDKNSGQTVMVDTSKILFICTGAFVGLNKIIEDKMKAKKPIGFTGNSERVQAAKDINEAKRLEEIMPQAVVDFGFIPELVGRFGTICTLDPLSTEDMVAIDDRY